MGEAEAGSGRIAYIGEEGQLHVVGPDGSGDRPVSFPDAPGPGWGLPAGREVRTWPAWSPDGRWLGCFRHPEGEDVGAAAELCAVEVDGVEERRLARILGQLPVYCRWSPQGDRLAVLSQDGEQLQLWLSDLDGEGERRVVDEGAPLFFSWMPDGEGLLVHVGTRVDLRGRLLVRRAGGRGPDRLIAERPGSFCTPFPLAEGLLVGLDAGSGTEVSLVAPAGDAEADRVRGLIALDGLVGFVPSPDGAWVAVSHAPRGEGTPYRGVWAVRLDGGFTRRLVDRPCLAFFWTPRGTLLVAGWDERDGRLSWAEVDPEAGEPRPLASFLPTRDQLFHLHFFEQFHDSHPLVTADGRYLVFAHHPGEPRGPAGPGEIAVIDLDAAEPRAEPLAAGRFAVCSPPPPTPESPCP